MKDTNHLAEKAIRLSYGFNVSWTQRLDSTTMYFMSLIAGRENEMPPLYHAPTCMKLGLVAISNSSYVVAAWKIFRVSNTLLSASKICTEPKLDFLVPQFPDLQAQASLKQSLIQTSTACADMQGNVHQACNLGHCGAL